MRDHVYAAIDFETSGRTRHSACAIGIARIEGHSVTETFYSLIRPPSARILYTHIHGLAWDDLKGERRFPEVWKEAVKLLDGVDYLVAHNAPFDRAVLRGCCEAFCQRIPALPFLCTLKGARKAVDLKSRSLDSLCHYFGINLQHHHAGSDARACALIFIALSNLGVTSDMMRLRENIPILTRDSDGGI